MTVYIVEVPVKGEPNPEFVMVDTTGEATARAMAKEHVGARTNGRVQTPSRVLVLREWDSEKIQNESIKQFVGPKNATVATALTGFPR
jgi:hypothetical protein